MTNIRRSVAALGMMTLSGVAAQNMFFGADNFYQSDVVTVQPVVFQDLYQLDISGNLFTHNTLNLSAGAPAIVVGHPMGAVKEQSANLYATKLAEQGFITLSINLPFYGGSEGDPRSAVLPDRYAEAFSAAVDYLGTQDLVDRERIGALGICGSGSFVISAAKIDPRIKAIATSSMYDMGEVNRKGLENAQSVEQRMEVIAAAAEQRWAEVHGGEILLGGGTPTSINNESTPIDIEFYDFYRTSRGEFTPEGREPGEATRVTMTSNVKFMNFYPFNDIDTISPRPMLFVSGDQAHSREFSENAYEAAAEPKELYWVPGAGHVDLYDRTELIPFDKFTQFFKQGLADKKGSC